MQQKKKNSRKNVEIKEVNAIQDIDTTKLVKKNWLRRKH